MKYVLTGSLGHISKPVAEKLIKAGHEVSIITSNAEKEAAINTLGATALTGNIEEQPFVTNAFKGADVVYLMIPPKWDVTDWFVYQKMIADNYIAAIKENNIMKVVLLSSIGAHMRKGAGPVDGLAYLETKLDELQNVNAVYLRPSYFYYNLLSMIPLIKNAGIMGSNQPAGYKLVLTHPNDIAEVAAEKLLNGKFAGKEIEYIGSDEKTWAEITNSLTKAVNKENIPWVEFTDEQSFKGMVEAGLPETIAKGYTQMGVALKNGEMQADYWQHKPSALGKTKLEDFTKEFARAYNS